MNMENLPKDPVLLMSFINTRLRDRYPSLNALCEDMGINACELKERLASAGFEYMPGINQFR